MTADRRIQALALAALALIAAPTLAPAKDPIVFVTAFAPGDKGGIHAYEFDGKAGKLKHIARTAGAENPFFLGAVAGQEVPVLDPRQAVRRQGERAGRGV